MPRLLSRTAIPALLVMLALGGQSALAQEREEAKLLTATEVLQELRGSRDQAIPDRLLERAYGIAVIPDVVKVGFVVGGRHGRGVLVVRDKNGQFTNPVFVRLAGGSFGWQAGAQETDVVLVFTTKRGIEGITDGKLTLGADASVAAGPLGRQASAATDATFSAEVYSYSRTRGLFAGVALDGTALTIDGRANGSYYGKRDVSASDIIAGSVSASTDASRRFQQAVASSTGPGASRSASAAIGEPPAASSASSPAAAPAPEQPAAGAQTFPLEDPAPGRPPE